jgi:hypothetical protein
MTNKTKQQNTPGNVTGISPVTHCTKNVEGDEIAKRGTDSQEAEQDCKENLQSFDSNVLKRS